MAEILDDVAYLSQEIGPRPAGTEEEQQAALYIADQVHKRTNLRAEIEDINCIANPELINLIYFGVSFACALLSMFIPLAGIPTLIITLLCALGWLFEEILNKPLLSKLFARDISQNIVVKYVPAAARARGASRRKIIVVANYDSGKVMKDIKSSSLKVLGYLVFAADIALLATPVILLFKNVIFLHGLAFFEGLFTVLLIIAMVLLLFALVRSVMHRVAAYNEAANCNASGIAVLLEAIRRIGGAAPIGANRDADEAPVVHGEEAAREAGVVPEEAELKYTSETVGAAMAAEEAAAPEGEEASEAPEPAVKPAPAPSAQRRPHPAEARADDSVSEEPASAEDRLRAAKAAIAALTGAPVSDDVYAESIADNLVQVHDEPIDRPSEEEVLDQRAEMLSAFSGGDYGDEQSAQSAAVPVEVAPASPEESAAAQDARGESAVIEQPAQPAVPDWFKNAQQKAKANKPAATSNIHRSRYADALDTAVKESSVFFNKANELIDEETETRLRQMRRGISEVKAPGRESEEPPATQQAVPEPAVSDARLTQPAPQPAPAPARPATPQAVPEPAVSDAPVAQVASQPALQPAPAPAQPAAPHPQPAKMAASAEEAAEPQPIARSQAPASPAQGLTGETIAMAPIDVSALREEEPLAAAAEAVPVVSPDKTVPVEPIAVEPATGAASATEPAPVEGEIAIPQVILPDLPEAKSMTPIADVAKQRAPLAVATAEDGRSAAKSLLSHTIPKIDAKDLSGDLGESIGAPKEETVVGKRANLITNLPSLSGSISSDVNRQTEKPEKVVSATGSFAAVSATGAFAPVGDELVADVAPEDLYVDDADDTVYGGGVTETGAFAGPDYVTMPKSRAGRFFGRFKRKKNRDNDEIETPQEWLNVDDGFDARSVGKARGDWSSFQQGSEYSNVADREAGQDEGFDDYYEDDYADDGYQDEYYEDDRDDGDSRDGKQNRNWNGGAFSNRRSRVKVDDEDEYADNGFDELDADDREEAFEEEDFADEEKPARKLRNPFSRKNKAGADDDEQASRRDSHRSTRRSSRDGGERVRAVDEAAAQETTDTSRQSAPKGQPRNVQNEVDDIYSFVDSGIETEVWFVALGAEMSGNAGMKAFIAEHESDLKGAIVVSLQGLGAGRLNSLAHEGVFKKYAPATRMKRFLRDAAQTAGVSIGQADMTWTETTSSCVMSHGIQAVSIAGMDGDKPALYSQSDDVCENVDEMKLQENTAFVMELLRSI